MTYPMLRAAALSMTMLARACGEEAAASPPSGPEVQVVAAPPSVAIAAAPAQPSPGGTVVAAGPAQLEVVSHASGEVYVYPVAGLEAPTRADVTVNVPVRDGAHPVPVRWVARENRYVGRVEGVTVVPGPATVTVVVGSAHYVGVSPILVVAPAIVVAVAPVVDVHFHHGKHKHRGRGHGRGHGRGNGHGGVRVRVH